MKMHASDPFLSLCTRLSSSLPQFLICFDTKKNKESLKEIGEKLKVASLRLRRSLKR